MEVLVLRFILAATGLHGRHSLLVRAIVEVAALQASQEKTLRRELLTYLVLVVAHGLDGSDGHVLAQQLLHILGLLVQVLLHVETQRAVACATISVELNPDLRAYPRG